jgi:hypothetical protein
LARAAVHLEPLPAGLFHTVEKRIAAASRQRMVRRVLAGLSAAAVLVMAAMLWSQWPGSTPVAVTVDPPPLAHPHPPNAPAHLPASTGDARQQLALFVVSHRASDSPPGHRWARTAGFSQPSSSTNSARMARRRPPPPPEPPSTDQDPPQVLLSSARFGPRCIQPAARWPEDDPRGSAFGN